MTCRTALVAALVANSKGNRGITDQRKLNHAQSAYKSFFHIQKDFCRFTE